MCSHSISGTVCERSLHCPPSLFLSLPQHDVLFIFHIELILRKIFLLRLLAMVLLFRVHVCLCARCTMRIRSLKFVDSIKWHFVADTQELTADSIFCKLYFRKCIYLSGMNEAASVRVQHMHTRWEHESTRTQWQTRRR